MSSDKIVIKSKSLNNYPDLKAFLESEPADVNLLSEQADYCYSVKLTINSLVYLNVLSILCLYGKTSHIKALEENSIEMKVAIKANNYLSYQWAATNGQLATLQHLETHLSADEIKAAVKDESYFAYLRAAQNGHLNTLRYLETHLSDDEIKAAVKAESYLDYRCAAENGHLHTLKYLETHLSDNEIKDAVKARDYHAYRCAAENGHLDTLKYLETHLSASEIKAAIKTDNYLAYQRAAENGHLSTLKYLETHLSADEIIDAVKARTYLAYRSAAENGHLTTVHHLLSNSSVLNIAESHDREYGRQYIYNFVSQKLSFYHAAKIALETSNPNAVYNVSDIEAGAGFYILRNLIRRGVDRDYATAEDHLDEIRFLLSIPAIKNLCHRSVNEGPENELLRLAMSLGHENAVELLLNIPAVLQLARQNNFYARENQSGIDYQVLARDAESSMKALTKGEQKRLSKILQIYEPMIETVGVAHLMDDLRETLIDEYYKPLNEIEAQWLSGQKTLEPGEILPDGLVLIDGKFEKLPHEKAAFDALGLTKDALKKANEYYYKNKAHTALRYISRPNLWMSPNASYVNVSDDRAERWSTFEEYQPLIALCYLAVIDESKPPVDGFTIRGRLEHFIDELYHIGRAHNFDRSRPALDKDGIQMVDKNNNPLTEEYDDLEGDKPSCFSGVKRRLFQSVQGHPDFVILTRPLVQQMLYFLLRDHFESGINDKNREALQKAYEAVAILLDEDEDGVYLKQLKVLDISPEQQQAFIQSIADKYGASFLEEPAFVSYVKNLLQLDENQAHAITLDGVAKVGELINKIAPTSSANSQSGFFSRENNRNESETGQFQLNPKSPS